MKKKNRELIGQIVGADGAVGRGTDMHNALNTIQSSYGIEDGMRGGNRKQKVRRAYEASGAGSSKGMSVNQMLQSLAGGGVSGGPAPIEEPRPPVAPTNPVQPEQPAQPSVGSGVWGNYGEGPELLRKYASLDTTGTVGGSVPQSGVQTGGGNYRDPNAIMPQGVFEQPQQGQQGQQLIGKPVPQQQEQRQGLIGNLPARRGVINQQAQTSTNPLANGFMRKVR
jgi:hypothetical protein